MAFKVTQELKDTLIASPKIEKVYIDASGNHHFNVFKLPTSKKDEDQSKWDQYGHGKFESWELIPGPNVDQQKEEFTIGRSDTKIVKVMTRDEVLDTDIENKGETLAQKVVNSSDEERGTVLAALGFTPEMLAALKNLTAAPKETAPVAAPKKS